MSDLHGDKAQERILRELDVTTLTLSAEELGDLRAAVGFAKRGVERLLSAGYQQRPNAIDDELRKREARFVRLQNRLAAPGGEGDST